LATAAAGGGSSPGEFFIAVLGRGICGFLRQLSNCPKLSTRVLDSRYRVWQGFHFGAVPFRVGEGLSSVCDRFELSKNWRAAWAAQWFSGWGVFEFCSNGFRSVSIEVVAVRFTLRTARRGPTLGGQYPSFCTACDGDHSVIPASTRYDREQYSMDLRS
jgi:hypothetical protein